MLVTVPAPWVTSVRAFSGVAGPTWARLPTTGADTPATVWQGGTGSTDQLWARAEFQTTTSVQLRHTNSSGNFLNPVANDEFHAELLFIPTASYPSTL
jgi:hypothetical protein